MSKKLTDEEYRQKVFDMYGGEYSVLGEYVNTKTPIKMRHNSDVCDNYEYYITPNHFLSGRKCKKCNDINFLTNVVVRKTTESFKQEVYDLVGDEYTVLGEYVDTHTDIEMRHNCELCNNHVYKVAPTEFLSGNRCPKCKGIRNRQRKVLTQEQVMKKLEPLFKKGYELLGEYVNNKVNMKMRCPNNHIFYASMVNLMAGHDCPYCIIMEKASSKEKQLKKFIKKLLPNEKIICNDRKLINPYELDIYIPNLKIAFEFDGIWFHSEMKGLNDGNKQHKKTELCEQKGIRLIHIFENEWNDGNKKKIIKRKIKYILNKADYPKIYARKCWIEEIDNKTKNNFLNKYHIQGQDMSSIRLGLYTISPKDENKKLLVSVMTFCKPRVALGHKNGTKYDYELSRFASIGNYIVIGGFSKLFEYFKRNYEWNSIITYADRKWSQGDIYLKNGWTHIRNSDPSYWYMKGNELFHRFKFRPDVLKKDYPELWNEEKSERNVMLILGYSRIYDCGNMVFEYNKE